MTRWTRRHLLGSIAGASGALAGCFEIGGSAGFTRTDVEDQQLVVEFDEDLDAEVISVVDPDGQSFAETSVSAGVTQATFDISLPYTPGEYRIIATEGDEQVAETTQMIEPELEIVDVGVGANRMDEMPDERGHAKDSEALVEVRNSGTGPESVNRLRLDGYLPSDRDRSDERIGILDPESGQEASSPVTIMSEGKSTLFTSTLPFSFEGDGVTCEDEPQSGEFTVLVEGRIGGEYSEDYRIEYSAADSYDGCDIEISQQE